MSLILTDITQQNKPK